ncbi:MAG: hypothetical protein JW955_12815 [Sedimentisphaerales bacterium]|nr:hypothetical protein [Sedimentisphaerales bacterium]
MRRALPVLLLLLTCSVPTSGQDLASTVIYVDDDSRSDPGRWDPSVSDPCENGTVAHPFDAIQEAIDAAVDGATVFVQSGRYCETVDLLGKRITLTGFDPNHPGFAMWPVLDGLASGPVVSFTHGEDADCVLSGLVITGGFSQSTGAILCSSSSPTIAHCLIIGNRAPDANGAAICCMGSNATFINCTISGNRAGPGGAALRLIDSNAAVINSILWGNAPAEILPGGTSRPAIRHSDVAGGWRGQDCIDVDPMFAGIGVWLDPDLDDPHARWLQGDYHLQSQMGRYQPARDAWTQDQATSPCIDAGDPCSPGGPEPSPNGGVINMGAYGGTVEASKSWSDDPIHFPDTNLKAAVEEELWMSDPTPADMLGLVRLIQPNSYVRESAIRDLTGLEYAVNLQELNLRYHEIRDISPLSGLSGLRTAVLLGNRINDLAPLSGLSDLETLDLEQNEIEDISALSGLSSLRSVGLHRNFISDIQPLLTLTGLAWIDLRANPMNREAYDTCLPQIQANNPGVTLLYDAFFTGRLAISSTPGGSVVRPGQGVFTCEFYEVVVLEAKADPGFEFVGWSGSCSTQDNPLELTMDQDYDLQANFQSTDLP